MSKKSTALAWIRQLTRLGLPGGLFISSALPTLRALVDGHSAAFFWLAPDGSVVNFYAEAFPLPGAAGEASEAFAISPVMGAVVATTVERETVDRNGFYAQILRQNRAEYLLHGVVRLGSTIGRICVFRDASGDPFGLAETADLSNVIRYVAQGLNGSNLWPRDFSAIAEDLAVAEQGMLIANRRGEIVYCIEKVRRLLLLSTGLALTPGTMPAATRAANELLHQLCAGRTLQCSAAPCSQLVRDTEWGRFVLHAYGLQDDQHTDGELVGVHIYLQQPVLLSFVNAMSALRLSPQQRDIALLIAMGKSNKDIAERLSVSVNTVAYHIKQLFLKLRVHDRSELLTKIHKGASLQPMDSGEAPIRRELPAFETAAE